MSVVLGSRPRLALLFSSLIALGLFASSASAQAPGNDNRSAAIGLSGNALTFTGDNFDATTQPGERLSCNPLAGPGVPTVTQYDSTVWFTYDPPSPGTAAITAAPGTEFDGNGDGTPDLVLSAYDPGGGFIGCVDHDDPFSAEGGIFFISGAGNPAPMALQIGGFDDGNFFEQGTFALTISFSKAPLVGSHLKYSFERFRKYTLLKRLKVNSEPGTITTVHCRGRGCPGHKERDFAAPNVNLTKKFKKSHLKRGADVDIFVTRPQSFGSFTELSFRPPKPPRKTVACIAAGDTDPTIQDVVPCQ
jgi:hypothetical protein